MNRFPALVFDYDWKSPFSEEEMEFIAAAWNGYDGSGYEIEGGGYATDDQEPTHEERVIIHYAISVIDELSGLLLKVKDEIEKSTLALTRAAEERESLMRTVNELCGGSAQGMIYHAKRCGGK